MKSSCITQPANNRYIQVSEWQIKFCNGNYCAALVLSHFIRWHNWKLNHDNYYNKVNNIAEMHGDGRPHNQNAYLFFTMDEISEGILGFFGKSTINTALSLLQELSVISVHKNPNPRYHFDKTKYFMFYPEVCNEWLALDASNDENKNNDDENYEIDPLKVSDRAFKNELSSSKSNVPSRKNSQAITYKTNNTTKEIKAAAEEGGNYKIAAAANFIAKEKQIENSSFENPPQDSVIGSELTPNQQKQIDAVAKNLHREMNFDYEKLVEEINYCILNPHNFKACGNDFLKKLNSIRVVIRRGEWQRPPEMVTKEAQAVSAEFKKLELELREAKAEVIHFSRLSRTNKNNPQFEKFINAAKEKALRLEAQINKFSTENRAVI